MRIVRILLPMTALVALTACDRPEPRTVQEFMADEIALTGTLVRCQDMGSESMRDPECQNARRASERLAALEEERERKAREEEFQRKRAALRERQEREREAREAAAAAARVAEEQALLGTLTFESEAPESTAGDAEDSATVSDQADSDPGLAEEPAGAAPAAAGSAVPAGSPSGTSAPDPQPQSTAPAAEAEESEDPVPNQ